MLKGYKYRLHPTVAQAEFLVRTIGCVRFVYNKLLEDRITIHEEAKAGGGPKRKPPTPASYKLLFPFLCEADSLALANAKLHLDAAFAKFFAGTAGFPVFKSKRKSRASYTTNNQHGTIRIEAGKVRLPKVGFIRFTQHRDFDGEIRSATVSMTRTGKFFVSLLVRQMEYKCKFYGRTLIKADPWFASTQVCSACGENGGRKGLHIREWTCAACGENGGKKELHIREWTCAACGAHHDRDVNASLNLLRLAEDIMSSGQGLPDELGQ